MTLGHFSRGKWFTYFNLLIELDIILHNYVQTIPFVLEIVIPHNYRILSCNEHRFRFCHKIYMTWIIWTLTSVDWQGHRPASQSRPPHWITVTGWPIIRHFRKLILCDSLSKNTGITRHFFRVSFSTEHCPGLYCRRCVGTKTRQDLFLWRVHKKASIFLCVSTKFAWIKFNLLIVKKLKNR